MSSYDSSNPLIVQSDRTVLLETAGQRYEEARDRLIPFAELVRSPEHVHTYRITPLSLWNAAAAGFSADQVIDTLTRYSKYEVPVNIVVDIRELMARYGTLQFIRRASGELVLHCKDPLLMTELRHDRRVLQHISRQLGPKTVVIEPAARGLLKQVLVRMGYPVEDVAGYTDGEALEIALRSRTLAGTQFNLRDYQQEAVGSFYAGGSNLGGSGVIVLPCGAGKTIVGMAIMAEIGAQTLILCTSIVAARQWTDELLDKTTLDPSQIGEYSGEQKSIRPVTISTYQILTYRKNRQGPFQHFRLFDSGNWGLIIYDEVHMLPAPVFRAVADLQARRRLGLTATLVREDGRENDVFSLIGPKRFDVPWKMLEAGGWIAEATCHELRLALAEEDRYEYAVAESRKKFRLASTNKKKVAVVEQLLEEHSTDSVLVIGQYLDQLHSLAKEFDAPLITGKTPNSKRQQLFEQFRKGEINLLIVSKVANFAIDLPDANVAIQISGTFGSRQEEAQRLGRILRPKNEANHARFYTIVTRDTVDQEFALKRQMFLTEQGYQYDIKIID